MKTRGFQRKSEFEQEMAEELQFHLEKQIAVNIAAGMDPEEARRRARLQLGAVEGVKAECRAERRGFWLESLWSDIRYGFRVLRKSPGFTTIAILTLALGIGATTAIFTVVNRFLLEPLPYPHSNRIVLFGERSGANLNPMINIPEYLLWRSQTQIIEDAAAFEAPAPINLLGGDHPEQLQARRATANYLTLFGYHVAMGRPFTAKEDAPEGPPVAVISHSLWKRRFGSDPCIVGKAIDLGGTDYTVIGVLAPRSPASDDTADVILPLQPDPNSTNLGHDLWAYGRLKRGVTIAQASAALKLSSNQFRRKYPDALSPKQTLGTETQRQFGTAGGTELLLIFLGAIGFVLLIACANVANLLLARETGRQREIAIRVVLGSSRGRVVRQILTEGVLLSLLGGALGLFLGYAGLQAMLAIIRGQYDIGRLGQTLTLDWRVLLFALGISGLAGALAGLVPAVRASHTNLESTIKDAGSQAATGMRHNKTRSLLVVVEIALAMVLLAGAGLFMRAFVGLRSANPGFEKRNVLTMGMSLAGARFAKTAAVAALVRKAQQRLDSLPGVEVAAASSCLPLHCDTGLPFNIADRAPAQGQWSGGAGWRSISPGYFRALRIPLLQGRTFSVNDSASSQPVVIINEEMAKHFWPKGGELGTQITIGEDLGPQYADPTREIVGVVGNVRDNDNGLYSNPTPTMYVPVAQAPDGMNASLNSELPMTWIIRTRVAPLSLNHEIQRQLRLASGGLPVGQVQTMDRVVTVSAAGYGDVVTLFLAFAALALLLAAVGIYGVISYSVTQRTHEIGIRMALGAQRRELLRLVMGRGARLALIGVGTGVAAALGLTRLMASLLYDVKAWDPATFTAVAILMFAVALLACYIPARQAMRVDAMTALRHE